MICRYINKSVASRNREVTTFAHTVSGIITGLLHIEKPESCRKESQNYSRAGERYKQFNLFILRKSL